MRPDIRYARNGDLSIAYQALGEGPAIVFVPGFVSHMEKYWELPSARRMMERFSTRHRFVLFDKRGTGLSDRVLRSGAIEERMDDVRAVMDAAEVERASLIGLSEGGPMALVFAATYPERVDKLALWSTFARGARGDDYPYGLTLEEVDPFLQRVRDDWGSGRALSFVLAGSDDDPETLAATASFERNASTPQMAYELLRFIFEIDARAALPAISAPTLVVHRRHDPAIEVGHARYLAEHIAGARLVELPGNWHIHARAEPDEDVRDLLLDFLDALSPTPAVEAERVLVTVLFTDIVESTREAASRGDRAWRELLEDHDRLSADEVGRQRGRVVKSTGDGLLATFDGPARAVRAAQALVDRAPSLGIEVRAGVHTGEIELRGDDVAGIAVHVGARVSALAGPGEVLVSSTVKDLVLGSGLDFEPRGVHDLKGVPGEWPVFVAVA